MRKSDFTLPTLDDLFSTQAERDDAKLERVRNIPLAELHPFKGHPFKVQNNEEMQRMIESIRKVGAITPALARPLPDGGYELIAGHRRHHASELAGMGKDRQSQQSQGLVVGLENIALIIFYDDTRIHLVHDQLVIFLFLDRLGFRLKKYLGLSLIHI